jgi:hypothetical protein
MPKDLDLQMSVSLPFIKLCFQIMINVLVYIWFVDQAGGTEHRQ